MLQTSEPAVDSKNSAAAVDTTIADTTNRTKFIFEDFKHPGVPALYTPRPKPNEKYIPYAVFGFPITSLDKDDFAQRFDFDPSYSYTQRRETATRKLMKDIPNEYKRYSPPVVLIEYYRPAMCIVLGTNETDADIYHTLDLDMIEDIHNILQTYDPPGWFIACDS